MNGVLAFPPDLPDTGGISVVEPQALAVYQADFPANRALPSVKGKTVQVQRDPHPANPAREFTYWHMVTEGPEETNRTPVLTRMVMIPRAKPLLVNHQHNSVKRWQNDRAGRRHICLWHPLVNYVLVIKECLAGLFLVTGYCPEHRRQLEFHREWAVAKKAGRTF